MTNPRDIWVALVRAGAGANAAAGIMGNMFYESSWNPEANALDTNGFRSYGLVQWNAASYPNAASLVTGNPSRDLAAQIAFLAKTGGFRAASGNSPSAAGSAFAANYERCVGCQPGGGQNSLRAAKAAQVAAMAKSGNWVAASGGTVSGGSASGPPAKPIPGCLVSIPLPSGVGFNFNPFGGGFGPNVTTSTLCLFEKSWARALIGGILLLGGAGTFLTGTVVLAAFGLRTTGARVVTREVGRYISKAPGRPAARAGAAVASAGS